jgi:hypothetical protein
MRSLYSQHSVGVRRSGRWRWRCRGGSTSDTGWSEPRRRAPSRADGRSGGQAGDAGIADGYERMAKLAEARIGDRLPPGFNRSTQASFSRPPGLRSLRNGITARRRALEANSGDYIMTTVWADLEANWQEAVIPEVERHLVEESSMLPSVVRKPRLAPHRDADRKARR